MRSRPLILGGLLTVAIFLLATELLIAMPRALEWHPFDYGMYRGMGQAVRDGINPYAIPHNFYPLFTIMWLFVPLSLLPEWFRFIWILFPVISILLLFRYEGVWLFLFVPFWFVLGDAMLDGVLLLPLAWLLSNRPKWAGLGMAILLLKPQVALLPALYLGFRWCVERDWDNLKVFSGVATCIVLPAFILDPLWPLQMLQAMPGRAEQTLYLVPLLTSSIWSWWSLEGVARFGLVLLLLVTGLLFWQAIRREKNLPSVLQLLNLLLVPVFYASVLVLVLPTLRGRNQILMVVLLSWAAFLLDWAMGGFGGGYAIIPLLALYFQTRELPVIEPEPSPILLIRNRV